jgi:hypothetical protein
VQSEFQQRKMALFSKPLFPGTQGLRAPAWPVESKDPSAASLDISLPFLNLVPVNTLRNLQAAFGAKAPGSFHFVEAPNQLNCYA